MNQNEYYTRKNAIHTLCRMVKFVGSDALDVIDSNNI